MILRNTEGKNREERRKTNTRMKGGRRRQEKEENEGRMKHKSKVMIERCN